MAAPFTSGAHAVHMKRAGGAHLFPTWHQQCRSTALLSFLALQTRACTRWKGRKKNQRPACLPTPPCHADRHISITRNIGLPDSLLSRFDLLFVVLDNNDAHRDREVRVVGVGAHLGLFSSLL